MNSNPRNPILAAALSLLVPGLGQLYAGRLARALAFTFFGALSFLLLNLLLVGGDLFVTLGYQVIAGSIFAVIVVADAWWVARQAPVDYQRDERNRLATYIWFSLLAIICTGFLAMVEVQRLQDEFRTYRIAGKSMAPNLLAGDMLYVNHEPFLESDPLRGEMVVFQSPIKRTQKWTSRVVALPGDTIEIREGVLYLNGESTSLEGSPNQESIGDFSFKVAGIDEVKDFPETKVPKHHAFLISDNRSNALDSRHFGPVSIGVIDGSLEHRYWPKSRMEKLNIPAKR